MDQLKVDIFIMSNGERLPEEHLPQVRKMMLEQDDAVWHDICGISFYHPVTALLFSILLGILGADRFYIRCTVMGVVKLLTLGGLGIWVILDWFLISQAAKEQNYRLLQKFLVRHTSPPHQRD